MSPVAAALSELGRRFGRRCGRSDSLRARHAHDGSLFGPGLPDAVVFPETSEEVAEVVRICARHGVPIVPFGAGSGQEGGAVALQGGISVDFTRMNQILAINVEDMDCLVEAGVTRLQLNHALRTTGLMFPVDLGADATIGGMVATGAAGTTTPLYGSMRSQVMELEVVMADGEIVRTGGAARKSSAGYDLTRLLVGSEGTLGLITRVRLRLHPVPESSVALRAPFPDFCSAVEAVVTVNQHGLPLARAELCDALMMTGLNQRFRSRYPERPTLFFEFHGATQAVDAAADTASEILREHGASSVDEARQPEHRTALWQLRHAVADGEKALRPGARVMVTDVAVPVSRLADFLAEARSRLDDSGLMAPLSGHMADGNFHFGLLVAADDEAEQAAAHAFKEWLAHRAIALDGTISGEHGIGLGKTDLMATQHGAALAVMQRIKSALDPQGLLNPGKLLPGAARNDG